MADLEYGTDGRTQILMLGGGFGGLYAALEWEKLLKRQPQLRERVDVTLIARDNFFLFTPMLHEVAASDLDPTHIVNPMHKLLKHVNFFCGEVEHIDLANRSVRVSHGMPQSGLGSGARHAHLFDYHHLVLGMGSVTNFGSVPGVEKHALTMRTLGDAIALRERLIDSLETANADCFAQMRKPLLTFVVAGGGFSGVETAGALNGFLRDAVKHYPHLNHNSVRVVVVHAGQRVLPELGVKLGEYATSKLREHGVEVMLGVRVAGVEAGCVLLSDGTRIEANTLVWTVGNAANPLLETLPCQIERGRICVNENLEVEQWPGVWALGDGALSLDENGQAYAPTAQHALRQGKVVAHNILASLRGETKKPFRFKTLGQLATIGRRSGVASVMGLQFSGFLAWWMWRTIYLAKLPRLEKKVRVVLDWTLDLFFSKDLVQLSTSSGQVTGSTLNNDSLVGNSLTNQVNASKTPIVAEPIQDLQSASATA
jgi:NADH dehydrogenase